MKSIYIYFNFLPLDKIVRRVPSFFRRAYIPHPPKVATWGLYRFNICLRAHHVIKFPPWIYKSSSKLASVPSAVADRREGFNFRPTADRWYVTFSVAVRRNSVTCSPEWTRTVYESISSPIFHSQFTLPKP